MQQQPRQQAPCSNTYSLKVTHQGPLTHTLTNTHLRLQLSLERTHVCPLDCATAAAHLAQQDVQVAVVPAHGLMQQVISEFARTRCAAAHTVLPHIWQAGCSGCNVWCAWWMNSHASHLARALQPKHAHRDNEWLLAHRPLVHHSIDAHLLLTAPPSAWPHSP